MKILKLLLALRSWKNGRSKMLDLGALLMLLPTVDAAFFTTDVGGKILEGFMWVMSLQPIWMVTPDGAVKFLVFVIGGLIVWLRAKTSEPLDAKLPKTDG